MTALSVYTRTLRSIFVSTCIWGVGLAAILLLVAIGWARAYPDAVSRAALAQTIHAGLSAADLIYGKPVAIETLGGFLGWRSMGIFPILVGLYALLNTTAVTRGAEETGISEVVMATAPDRLTVVLSQLAAVSTGILVLCGVTAATLVASGPLAGEAALSLGRCLVASLNLLIIAALYGFLALLLAQFSVQRRSAVMLGGALLFGFHVWNNLGYVVPALDQAHSISPSYLYARSTPLADGHVDIAALLALTLLTLATLVVAIVLLMDRDMFSAYHLGRRNSRQAAPVDARPAEPSGPAQSRLLASPFGRGLRDSTGATLGWSVALIVLTALMASITPAATETLTGQAQTAGLRQLLSGRVTQAGVLSLALFSFLALLLALFAVFLVDAWASEEGTGRLDLELATPVSRTSYFAQRLGAMATCSFVAIITLTGCLFVCLAAFGLDVSASRVAEACATLLPLALSVLAAGFALAAWRPRLAAGLTGLVIAASFFVELLVPLLGWPSQLQSLSIFHLYGQPMMDSINTGNFAALCAITIVLALTGAWGFQRRDIEK